MRQLVVILVATTALPVADGDFDTPPTGYVRATTEIHGDPWGAAHVENNWLADYPFDGSVVILFEDSEVDYPPRSNPVTFVGTFELLGPLGQHFELSFFGPNAIEGSPDDDLPIFVDLYGTYTDSDNPAGPITGTVDLFDVGATAIGWKGIDARDLFVDPQTALATIVDTDGQVVQLGFEDHPFRVRAWQYGNDDYRLGVKLYSAVDFAEPWVPELLDSADEVHITFDVYIPEPATILLLCLGGLVCSRSRWSA